MWGAVLRRPLPRLPGRCPVRPRKIHDPQSQSGLLPGPDADDGGGLLFDAGFPAGAAGDPAVLRVEPVFRPAHAQPVDGGDRRFDPVLRSVVRPIRPQAGAGLRYGPVRRWQPARHFRALRRPFDCRAGRAGRGRCRRHGAEPHHRPRCLRRRRGAEGDQLSYDCDGDRTDGRPGGRRVPDRRLRLAGHLCRNSVARPAGRRPRRRAAARNASPLRRALAPATDRLSGRLSAACARSRNPGGSGDIR